MTTSNAEIMRNAMTNIVQEGDVSHLDEAFASDFMGHDTAGETFTLDDFRWGVREMLDAFSERQVEIADQVAAGDKVVTRYVVSGRHTGAYRGIPPTQRTFQMTGISIDRFASGRIIESWEITDDMGLLRQLGVVPAAESPLPVS